LWGNLRCMVRGGGARHVAGAAWRGAGVGSLRVAAAASHPASGGVPLCDSSSIRGGFRLVKGAVAQHREQHVAAPSSKSDERLIVALALLDLAGVIVP
jgi:filamentous hemagglutinin